MLPGRSDLAVAAFLTCFMGWLWKSHRLLRVAKFTHGLTVARTGGGKGVSFIIVALKSYLQSMVITDPKGENYHLTADFRRRKLRHRVYKLDPFGITGAGSQTYNPLDAIDENADDFLDQCRELANAMVVRTGHEPDPHWNDSAQLVICAMIVFVCACERDPDRRNLATVRKILSARHSFKEALEAMQTVEGRYHGVIAKLGGQLTWLEGKEMASVLTTVQRHTEFLDSIPIQRNTAESSFDPRSLRSGRATLYLILPHDKMESLAAVQRLWLHTIIRSVTRGPVSESNPILFLLDEAAHLGRLQIIEDALTLMRGMGIRIWLILQSLDQLKKCFGDRAATILDNIETQQYFAINSYESSEALSKRIGERTIGIQTTNTSSSYSSSTGGAGNAGGNKSTTTSTNYSEIGRRLITASEILGLPEDMAIVLHKNLPPVFAQLVRYYDAPEFARGRAGKSRRIGLTTLALALLLLVGGYYFCDLCEVLPQFIAMQRQAGMAEQDEQASEPYNTLPYGVRQPRTHRYQSNAERDLPSRSGYLIKIE